MSIRQPKPKQIRLPFDVPKPKKGADAPVKVCGICRSKDSHYTCPRCNVAYCSLACFRDQSHTQCSEPFYRSTVVDQIAADPKAELEEKRRMMDMLRRFEDAAAEGDDVMAALEEDSDDDDDLAAALDGVDLEDIDSNALLRLLPQAHRDAFLAAIKNPESESAKELLESALAAGEGEEGGDDNDEPPLPSVLPWWEAGELDDEAEAYASPPADIDTAATDSINPPPGVGVKLGYNLLALCLAYTSTLLSFRLPSLSEEYLAEQRVGTVEVKDELQSLLPFLEARSTVRYESARAAWGAVWERVGRDGEQPPAAALVRLLQIAAGMLHPPITTDPPRVALVLAGVHSLFSAPKAGATAKKMAFYRAAMKQVDRQEWLSLEREVLREAQKLDEELEEPQETQEPARPSLTLL